LITLHCQVCARRYGIVLLTVVVYVVEQNQRLLDAKLNLESELDKLRRLHAQGDDHSTVGQPVEMLEKDTNDRNELSTAITSESHQAQYIALQTQVASLRAEV